MLNANSECWLAGVPVDKFGLCCKFPIAITPAQCVQHSAVPSTRQPAQDYGMCNRMRKAVTQCAACLLATVLSWLC